MSRLLFKVTLFGEPGGFLRGIKPLKTIAKSAEYAAIPAFCAVKKSL
jgi:hypothetical protein